MCESCEAEWFNQVGLLGAQFRVDTGKPVEVAMSVVVFRHPGPPAEGIEEEARRLLAERSPAAPDAGLAYLFMDEPVFDRLWDAVEAGETLDTAFDILTQLGWEGGFFVGRVGDFVFGWILHQEIGCGQVLILQVFPRPHMVRRLRAQMN